MISLQVGRRGNLLGFVQEANTTVGKKVVRMSLVGATRSATVVPKRELKAVGGFSTASLSAGVKSVITDLNAKIIGAGRPKTWKNFGLGIGGGGSTKFGPLRKDQYAGANARLRRSGGGLSAKPWNVARHAPKGFILNVQGGLPVVRDGKARSALKGLYGPGIANELAKPEVHNPTVRAFEEKGASELHRLVRVEVGKLRNKYSAK